MFTLINILFFRSFIRLTSAYVVNVADTVLIYLSCLLLFAMALNNILKLFILCIFKEFES